MTDPILKKAKEKRDEALREAERWEAWIKAYVELSEPAIESLDIPMARRTLATPQSTESLDTEPALRPATLAGEMGNGKSIWPRGGAPDPS